ncbi:hypothetical protein [Streptomyces musisoli]|uniref:hypothetical protein n=1 Tax=Streptomyces musisoli TaxID=2802280 RepID=UPI001F2178DC|nr:hypothetical protein [Streptomyces musisoli]
MIAQDAGRLRPAAAHHLTYHHGLEVVFTDTGFVSCPAAFQEPRFREPTVEETARPRRTLGETPSPWSRSKRTAADRSRSPA